MEQNNVNVITPINTNTNLNSAPQNIQPINQNSVKPQDNNFTSSLPDWDLLPPFQVVKRVNR